MTRQRVLAIRPDPALVTVLTSVLNPRYYELECAAGNIDTVRRLRSRAFDVVITDPSTSIDEDVALTLELRSVRPEIKAIVLAPEASHGDLLDAIRADVFACFTPPFDYKDIASMTASALAAENWAHAIQVVSGSAHWLTLKVACHLLTADRVVRFMTELQSSAPDESRDLLIAAFRELLVNAMEHGAGFDPEKVVEVTAARTHRAIVFHFKDPGTGSIAPIWRTPPRRANRTRYLPRRCTAPRPGSAGRVRDADRQPRRRRNRLQRARQRSAAHQAHRLRGPLRRASTSRPPTADSRPRPTDPPTAGPPAASARAGDAYHWSAGTTLRASGSAS